MTQILNDRIKELLLEKRISKAEISEKLGIGYSTLWRRLNGERGINANFLMELASILCTTVSYLLGETDSPLPNDKNKSLNSTTDTDNLSTETMRHETPGHLIFKHGEYCVDIPDTPSNQKWFQEMTTSMLMKNS